MRAPSLVHPQRLSKLPLVFASSCAIQANTPVRSSAGSGAQIDQWDDVAGQDAIRCRVMPLGGAEIRLPEHVVAISSNLILLAGAYPGVTVGQRAVVSGNSAGTYDITDVNTDGGADITQLAARIVSPSG